VAVKPISEWTDDDLQSHVHPYYHTKVNALAAEVLRLREEVDRQQRNTMEALAEADEYSAELDRTVIQLEKTMARETEVVVRANTAERKAGEWRAASFAVDAQLRHAQTERDTLNVDAKAWLDNCRKEQARAERAEAALDRVLALCEDHDRIDADPVLRQYGPVMTRARTQAVRAAVRALDGGAE
jgi:hypothetical protein